MSQPPISPESANALAILIKEHGQWVVLAATAGGGWIIRRFLEIHAESRSEVSRLQRAYQLETDRNLEERERMLLERDNTIEALRQENRHLKKEVKSLQNAIMRIAIANPGIGASGILGDIGPKYDE